MNNYNYNFDSAKLFFNGSFISNNVGINMCQEVTTLTQAFKGIVAKYVTNRQVSFKLVSNEEIELLKMALQFNKGDVNFCKVEGEMCVDKKSITFMGVSLLMTHINYNIDSQFIFNYIYTC